MIYVCVPVHNEASTVGLVLWKVRQVFTAFQREYQILACDDGSNDGTKGVLSSYARVLPLTIVTHRDRQGYARSLEELLRLALQRTDRPKRDCAITLHADFTHAPETMEEMVKRLESGADLVVAEVDRTVGTRSWPERVARRFAPRLLPVAGIRDSVSGFAALRLIALRQATRPGEGGATAPLLTTEGWCANAELLARLSVHARRIERVPTAARYDLKQRPSREKPWHQMLAVWRARGLIRKARGAGVTALVAWGLLGGTLAAQDTLHSNLPIPPAPPPGPVGTFPTGERLTFQAKYGLFNVGTAVMEVMGIDTVRGEETVHIQFRISGGALWYHLDQTIESWVGRWDFRSRRYHSVQDERDRHRERRYEIFPDSGFYREEGRDTTFLTVPEPLDDASFLYWVRTVPLEIGKRYEYARYFRPDLNPVIIEVLRRERVSVAGKKWHAVVIRPRIPRARGIFGEKSETRIWLSDDDRRLVLAIQSNFSFGQVTLKLKEFVVPGAAMTDHREADFSKLKTVPVANRPNKIDPSLLGHAPSPPGGDRSFEAFWAALPSILAAQDLRFVVDQIVAATGTRAILAMLGGHVIKVGLGPLLIALMRRRAVTHVAMNGSAAIHDFELAAYGGTSEDVAAGLGDGTFGMAEETGRDMNGALAHGAAAGHGAGQALAEHLRARSARDLPGRDVSVLVACAELGVPVTVHTAIGAEIIHQHPAADGAVLGATSHRDFKRLAEGLSGLDGGGVVLNLGSAVMMPEVFLKALTIARNLHGGKPRNFTACDCDMQRHYRPRVNVVERPTLAGGRGIQLTGHHEILFPLMAWGVLTRLDPR